MLRGLQHRWQTVFMNNYSAPQMPRLGDLNHYNLNTALPGFEQYIKFDTKKNRILDKCYDNVKDVDPAKAKTPLSNSDHNTVNLIPTYKQ